jgi:transcriptional regulator with XRE-family HTH domain
MTTTLSWTLGDVLRKRRRDLQIDQMQLAERTGIARTSLSNYERGRSVPPLDVALKLARALDVDLEVLATAALETTDQKVRGSSPFGRTLC